MMKVDLTAYVEKHEFCFDAVLDEQVSNDEVIIPSWMATLAGSWDKNCLCPPYVILIVNFEP